MSSFNHLSNYFDKKSVGSVNTGSLPNAETIFVAQDRRLTFDRSDNPADFVIDVVGGKCSPCGV
ncbi:BBT_HP_G0054510.mRNA.1.CDS.1 [Saccharomyces cerevisiae]|nr:BBT_HP_G0054510.mRNA.1.CDS.1 [Saccharomyces cerevisiae]CAI6702935.1 BBT_HP_G0054510.mRNA.1.CDS.1 [Saccharomyces cerevisiae]